MLILILGGSGCGKSAYAEKRIVELASENGTRRMPIYYLATMHVYGEEGQRKVERHRAMRLDKGMFTVEQTSHVARALSQMEPGDRAVILEDLGNLVANEMFDKEQIPENTADPMMEQIHKESTDSMMEQTHEESTDSMAERIVREIMTLYKGVDHLVLVSNNVFEDGIEYEASTDQYIRVLGKVNTLLAKDADSVVEVVVGIPLEKKRGNSLT